MEETKVDRVIAALSKIENSAEAIKVDTEQRKADYAKEIDKQIEIFDCSAGVFAVFVLCPRLHVACYLDISGNGELFGTTTYIYTATGTPIADIVAGNAAAGYGEG